MKENARTLRSKNLRYIVWKLSDGKCYFCGEPVEDAFDIHHVRPYIQGGPTRLWNLRAAHPSCNRGDRSFPT
jgi:5-methylcytosine-specific restriction endonuclease McrA